MERLTERDENGNIHFINYTKDKDIIPERLSAYEDTELTPEEVIYNKDALETEIMYSEYWKSQTLKSYEIIQSFKKENEKLREALKGGVSE